MNDNDGDVTRENAISFSYDTSKMFVDTRQLHEDLTSRNAGDLFNATMEMLTELSEVSGIELVIISDNQSHNEVQ